MISHVDPYAIATNGLIANDNLTIIIDPLGYYVIRVEEKIVTRRLGGIPDSGKKIKEEKKKIISISVTSWENDILFKKEIELEDIDLKVKNIELQDKELHVNIYNPLLNEEKNPIIVKIF